MFHFFKNLCAEVWCVCKTLVVRTEIKRLSHQIRIFYLDVFIKTCITNTPMHFSLFLGSAKWKMSDPWSCLMQVAPALHCQCFVGICSQCDRYDSAPGGLYSPTALGRLPAKLHTDNNIAKVSLKHILWGQGLWHVLYSMQAQVLFYNYNPLSPSRCWHTLYWSWHAMITTFSC